MKSRNISQLYCTAKLSAGGSFFCECCVQAYENPTVVESGFLILVHIYKQTHRHTGKAKHEYNPFHDLPRQFTDQCEWDTAAFLPCDSPDFRIFLHTPSKHSALFFPDTSIFSSPLTIDKTNFQMVKCNLFTILSGGI